MAHWSTADLAEAVGSALRARAAADDAEQAVYGVDALDELRLHPIVRQGLRDAGFGVLAEQRYPGHWNQSRRSVGERCDIVLTPRPDLPLRDAEMKGTLFGLTEAVDGEEAYWLEVKTVAQHETSGPFVRYAAELLSPVVRDVKKLLQDEVIRHAGLLLVLFTESREIAEHDLRAWQGRCLDRGYAVSPPAVRGFSLNDRIGNRWCAAAVFGVRG